MDIQAWSSGGKSGERKTLASPETGSTAGADGGRSRGATRPATRAPGESAADEAEKRKRWCPGRRREGVSRRGSDGLHHTQRTGQEQDGAG